MIISINDEFQIERLDDLNFCVQRCVRRKEDSPKGYYKKGDTYWANHTYHPTLGHACKHLATLIDDGDSVTTLDEYAASLARKCDMLLSAVNERFKEATK